MPRYSFPLDDRTLNVHISLLTGTEVVDLDGSVVSRKTNWRLRSQHTFTVDGAGGPSAVEVNVRIRWNGSIEVSVRDGDVVTVGEALQEVEWWHVPGKPLLACFAAAIIISGLIREYVGYWVVDGITVFLVLLVIYVATRWLHSRFSASAANPGVSLDV